MRILAVVALLALVACDSGAGVAPAPDATPNAVVAPLDPAAAQVVAACPGLQEYAGDWTLAGITPRNDGSGSTVAIVMDEAPALERIPADFYASGQHCYFEVGGERSDRVSVAKRPCVSVCKGRPFDGPSSTDIVIR
jgi:hypothetical protein